MGSSASKTTSSSSSSSLCCSASTSPPVTKLNSKVPSPLSPARVPKAFSFPMPSVHHPPAKEGDTHHLVSLKSTTYGSLHITDLDGASNRQTLPHISLSGNNNNKKIPEPEESRDSLSPDSVINTWELMNDLDDDYLDNGNGKHDYCALTVMISPSSTTNLPRQLLSTYYLSNFFSFVFSDKT
ncbi:BnaC03g23290D [Brassica napus]|uniref:(rape) hypothetical protein n=1 Tax=Brassica napus TaxID=3708 RepID=A0A078GB00_BRANA|nr:unnamed protein product [Brassica napus]CDY22519.1 BnaC03g23290D [Brassica napus]